MIRVRRLTGEPPDRTVAPCRAGKRGAARSGCKSEIARPATGARTTTKSNLEECATEYLTPHMPGLYTRDESNRVSREVTALAISRDDAQVRFGQYFPPLRRAMIEARAQMDGSIAEIRHALTGGTLAGVMHNLTVAHARRIFSEIPGVYFTHNRGLFLVHIGDEAVIRFKKFSRLMRTRSILTRQARMFNNPHLQLAMAEMPAEAERFTVGYRLDESQSAMVGMYFTQPDGLGCEWWLEMDDGIGVAAQIITAAPPQAPMAPVKLKKKAQSETGVASDDDAGTAGTSR